MAMYRQTTPEYRALVVENEVDFRSELIYSVETLDAGVSVTGEAADFDDAMELLDNEDFDLLITDINLTDEPRFEVGHRDGTVLARHAREIGDIPAIFLTAFADYDPAVVQEAARSDPIGFMQKRGTEISTQMQALIRLALRRLETSRRERELTQQLESVVQQLGEGLLFIDEEGYVLDFNENTPKLLQLEPDALADQYWEDVIRVETLVGTDPDSLRALIDGGVSARLPTVALQRPSGDALLASVYIAPSEHLREPCTLVLIRDLGQDASDSAQYIIEPGACLAMIGVNPNGTGSQFDPVRLRILMRELQSALLRRVRPGDRVLSPSATAIGVVLPDTDENLGSGVVNTLLAGLADDLGDRYPELQLQAGTAFRSPERSSMAAIAAAANALDRAQSTGVEQVLAGSQGPEIRDIESAPEKSQTALNMAFRMVDRLFATPMDKTRHLSQLVDLLDHSLGGINRLRMYGLATTSDGGDYRWLAVRGQKPGQGMNDCTISDLPPALRRSLDMLMRSDNRELRSVASGELGASVQPLVSQDRIIGHICLVAEVADRRVRGPTFEEKQVSATGGRYIAQLLEQCEEYRQPVDARNSRIGEGYNLYSLRPELEALQTATLLLKLDCPIALIGSSGTGRSQLIEEAARNVPGASCKSMRIIGPGSLGPDPMLGLHRLLGGLENTLVVISRAQEFSLKVQQELGRILLTRQVNGPEGLQALSPLRFALTLPRRLDELVANGKLHETLASALLAGEVLVPGLEANDSESLRWAQALLEAEAACTGTGPRHFDEEARKAIREHSWPGNLLELQERISDALARSPRSNISVLDLGLFRLQGVERTEPDLDAGIVLPSQGGSLSLVIRDVVEVAANMVSPPPVAQWLEDEMVAATLDRFREDRDPLASGANFLGVDSDTLRARVRQAEESTQARLGTTYWQAARLATRQWINGLTAIPGDYRREAQRQVRLALGDRFDKIPAERSERIARNSYEDYIS